MESVMNVPLFLCKLSAKTVPSFGVERREQILRADPNQAYKLCLP